MAGILRPAMAEEVFPRELSQLVLQLRLLEVLAELGHDLFPSSAFGQAEGVSPLRRGNPPTAAAHVDLVRAEVSTLREVLELLCSDPPPPRRPVGRNISRDDWSPPLQRVRRVAWVRRCLHEGHLGQRRHVVAQLRWPSCGCACGEPVLDLADEPKPPGAMEHASSWTNCDSQFVGTPPMS